VRHSHHSSTLTLVQSDRRTARRFGVDELRWLEHVRLQYGPSVSLIDLSTGGASFEAERPLRPGAATVLELGAEHEQRVVAGRIIRCEVVELRATSMRFRGACVFGRPLRWTEQFPSIGVSTPTPAQPSGPAAIPPVTWPDEWTEVLLAFLHGRFLKGFTRGFHPSRAVLDIVPSRTASETQAQKVPLTLLRTVLFLRQFGAGEHASMRAGASPRKIEVTFKDNYVMTGTTLDYEEGTPGFLVTSGGMTMFVVSASVRDVRYL
jgi:hypothetical protein